MGQFKKEKFQKKYQRFPKFASNRYTMNHFEMGQGKIRMANIFKCPINLKLCIARFICALIFICSSVETQAQTTTKGTEFWFGFMENLTLSFNGPPNFYLLISADEATSGKIIQPRTGLEIPFIIAAETAIKLDIPSAIYYKSGSDVFSDFGFQVVSEKAIEVKAVHNRLYFSDASIVYPISMMGTNYHVLTTADFQGQNPSAFLIVASEDNTKIQITPTVLTLAVKPPGKTYEINLSRGETYQVQGNGDLSGTVIKSSDHKKIAVFCGARQAFVGANGCNSVGADNHLYEEILPDAYAGKTFVFVPMALRGGDPITIMAIEDGTNFTLTGGPITLNAGGHMSFTLYTSQWIQSDKPIFVAQYCKSLTCGTGSDGQIGDPSIFYLQPTEFYAEKAGFYAPDLFARHFVNISCPKKSLNSIKLDNASISPKFSQVNGNSDFYAASIEVNEGPHQIKSDSGFLGYAYGLDFYNAYTYGLGFKTNRVDEALAFKFKVFPNPVGDQLTLSYPLPQGYQQNITYQLYDAVGRKLLDRAVIMDYSQQEIRIDMEPFAPAFYFLNIISGENSASQSFKILKPKRSME